MYDNIIEGTYFEWLPNEILFRIFFGYKTCPLCGYYEPGAGWKYICWACYWPIKDSEEFLNMKRSFDHARQFSDQ